MGKKVIAVNITQGLEHSWRSTTSVPTLVVRTVSTGKMVPPAGMSLLMTINDQAGTTISNRTLRPVGTSTTYIYYYNHSRELLQSYEPYIFEGLQSGTIRATSTS